MSGLEEVLKIMQSHLFVYRGIVDLHCCVIPAVQKSDSVIHMYTFLFMFFSILFYEFFLIYEKNLLWADMIA